MEFRNGVRDVILQDDTIDNETVHAYFNGFGASSLDVLVICYFNVNDYSAELQAKHRLLLKIMQLAQSIGVEFAFPTQTLHVETPIQKS